MQELPVTAPAPPMERPVLTPRAPPVQAVTLRTTSPQSQCQAQLPQRQIVEMPKPGRYISEL